MQGDQLAFDDGRRAEDIARIFVQMLAAKKEPAAKESPSVWLRWADGIKANWPVVLAATSAAIAAAAWGIFGVSPIESYREIAQRRQQRELQQDLARLHLNLGTDFLNVGQIQAARTEFTRVRELESLERRRRARPVEGGGVRADCRQPRRSGGRPAPAGGDPRAASRGHPCVRVPRQRSCEHRPCCRRQVLRQRAGARSRQRVGIFREGPGVRPRRTARRGDPDVRKGGLDLDLPEQPGLPVPISAATIVSPPAGIESCSVSTRASISATACSPTAG